MRIVSSLSRTLTSDDFDGKVWRLALSGHTLRLELAAQEGALDA